MQTLFELKMQPKAFSDKMNLKLTTDDIRFDWNSRLHQKQV